MAPKPAPAPTTGKRKRDNPESTITPAPTSITVQIVTGSYERVLHGLQATFPLPLPTADSVSFNDTFLFHAHHSSIRSLALSPPSSTTTTAPSKRILATGSTDERINLYQISSTAPAHTTIHPKPLPLLTTTPSASSTNASSTSTNRELGSLLHHASAITSLHFPSRTKLLSASLDNTIAVVRIRDWTVLSTLRAPAPKALNRPSGDTSAPGDTPMGINALAVHPGAKLAISVGQGEKCMRLWDLVRGKRGGVLVFERGVLEAVGEGRVRGGEGRGVIWGGGGREFVVAFERGCVVFGLDCVVRGVVRVEGGKVCQVRYLPVEGEEEEDEDGEKSDGAVLAVSTEDGRVLFYDTNPANAVAPSDTPTSTTSKKSRKAESAGPGQCRLLAQIGTSARGTRVKDFEILRLPSSPSSSTKDPHFILITGTSSGTISLWSFSHSDLISQQSQTNGASPSTNSTPGTTSTATKQIGTLLGTYETGRRITCLVGFVMDEPGVVRSGKKVRKARDSDDDEDEDGLDGTDGSDKDDGEGDEEEEEAGEEEDEDGDSDSDSEEEDKDEDGEENGDGNGDEEDDFGGFDD